MKKTVLFIFGLSFNIILGCYNPEQKDRDDYSTNDTARPTGLADAADSTRNAGYHKL